MLPKSILEHTLVLDIETVSAAASYAELSPTMQKLWALKAEALQRRLAEEEKMTAEDYYPEKQVFMQNLAKLSALRWAYLLKMRRASISSASNPFMEMMKKHYSKISPLC
ncbi:polysaccharide biosynthesis protein [Saprospira grandis str. Lewin]|uniref:Polysaccharide biosynthesis protein n=1 Tax=Saprospira grandis (strain Lewin) TaxID=984262 RepID=H6L2K4_SAPGL|nr:hypothetical protein [Saprospira grandis]AFC23662.1 polysaccharide biosynthesis protein [Saprospira grandis str. Lewin]